MMGFLIHTNGVKDLSSKSAIPKHSVLAQKSSDSARSSLAWFTPIRSVCECGQAMVEFALVLPVFLAMLFAIIDFGWMGYQVACFNYGYMNASWSVAASNMVNYDYEAKLAGPAQDNPEVCISEAICESALPGFDENQLYVTNVTTSLHNVQQTSSVPTRTGAEQESKIVQRYLMVEATVTYYAHPLIGLSFFEVPVEKTLSFERTVGVQQRA